MKISKLKGMLGVALSTGLIFALIGAIFVSPVAADETKWTKYNTPSAEDGVIVPGADIYHYDIDGDDGDLIVAVGALNGSDDCGVGSAQGVTGSFSFVSGSIKLTGLTATEAEISVTTAKGDTSCLAGQFTAILDVQGIGFGFGHAGNRAYAAVTGKITHAGTVATGDDTMEFSGKLYIDPADSFPPDGTYNIGPDIFCVDDWIVDPASGFGDVDINGGQFTMPRVWMSDDGGVTWDDITADVMGAANLPGPFVQFGYGGVSIAPDDPDWLVVSGGIFHPDFIGVKGGLGAGALGLDFKGVPATVATKDGADNFSYAGDMEDPGNGTWMALIYDVEVSIETDENIHIIAIAGMNSPDMMLSTTFPTLLGSVFRLDAGTWLTGTWEDTSAYAGWDETVGGATFATWGVVDGEFSPNFDVDVTYVCIGVSADTRTPGPPPYTPGTFPYLQMGLFESGTWNGEAGYPGAVEINSDGDDLWTEPALQSMAIALPDDYDGTDPGARSLFLYVNAWNTVTTLVRGFVFRLDNAALSPTCGPSGDPLLASIDVHGDADTGKMMIGEYIQWDDDDTPPDYGSPQRFDCCAGVRVWYTEELDFCCPQWDEPCKNPSGPYGAQVMFTPNADKAYATTSGMIDWEYYGVPPYDFMGGLCDESAFSVALLGGSAVAFNQTGIIDTDIDWLSDVAVCPDCGVIYLSTVNTPHQWCAPCEEKDKVCQVCACDSVWRSYDDGDTWERVYHGDWTDYGHYGGIDAGELLLRLACDAVDDCCDNEDPASPSGTLYLAVQGTKDIFYSRDCGQCWNEPPATKITIQDVAVENENTIYVLDEDGYVSKSTQYGRRWSDKADTGVDSGHSITSCCDQEYVVVGGNAGGKVGWSDDGGDSWNQTDALPSEATGSVHVACATTCENIVYAAVSNAGIYRTDLTDGAWDDLAAIKYGYYGIAVGRSDGTLYASSDWIFVDTDPDLGICDRFTEPWASEADEAYSGVARNLEACETACCGTESWDYLICGLTKGTRVGVTDVFNFPGEQFNNEPSALRICGCISSATNSVLYAIDSDGFHNGDRPTWEWKEEGYEAYDLRKGEDGTLWTYEDCAAKLGPTLTSPSDGAVIDCEPCLGCDASNFTLKWERMCNACSYDIQIMDDDGNLIVEWVDVDITGDPPELFIDGWIDSTEYSLECGGTYTWKVREADTACECIHSPWSETWSFTVTVGAVDAIKLLSPNEGELGVPIENIGFSWSSVTDASSYSFVLAPTAALTGALVSQDLSTTAFNFVGPLDYGKAYYWQIKAWKDGVLLTTSNIGVFNTGAAPVPAPPPVVVEPGAPAPVIQIPPTQMITPTWIYAIIGIGAALAVVVIVLIVRTRRP